MKLNHSDTIKLLTPRAIADNLGVPLPTVYSWSQRSSIPSKYWPGIVVCALKQGKFMNYDALALAAAERRAA